MNGTPESTGLFLALVIGIGFGWFLERGGLGNARKLAGQFYFTVIGQNDVISDDIAYCCRAVTGAIACNICCIFSNCHRRIAKLKPTFRGPVGWYEDRIQGHTLSIDLRKIT